jgi:hypothetical protein
MFRYRAGGLRCGPDGLRSSSRIPDRLDLSVASRAARPAYGRVARRYVSGWRGISLRPSALSQRPYDQWAGSLIRPFSPLPSAGHLRRHCRALAAIERVSDVGVLPRVSDATGGIAILAPDPGLVVRCRKPPVTVSIGRVTSGSCVFWRQRLRLSPDPGSDEGGALS